MMFSVKVLQMLYLTYMTQDLVVAETRWEKVCPNGLKMPSENKKEKEDKKD